MSDEVARTPMTASRRRVKQLAGHLGRGPPGPMHGGPVAAVPTMGAAGMMSSLVPMLAIGAYMFFQNRGKNKEEKRALTDIERLAEDLGFDAERLDALGEWAEKLTKKKQLPGVVMAVARKGQVIYHEAFGDRSYQRDCILAIEGMAMPMVTAAFMSLVDEGLVTVEDDVTQYLPSFANFRVYRSGSTQTTLETDPIGMPIKVKHLLTHTWGFPGQYYMASRNPEIRLLDEMAAAVNPIIGVDADFDSLTEIPLLDQPGRRYRMGLSMSVVGHIMCKITGQSLPEILQERIFTPLGMEDTQWFVPAEKQHRIATYTKAMPWLTGGLGLKSTGPHAGHTAWMGWKAKEERRDVPESCPDKISEQSSIYSTSLDALKFQAMLAAGGMAASGERVLSAASAQMMTTDQLGSMGCALADADFNSHSRDRKGSSGIKSAYFGVEAEGQGLGLGTQVVTRPGKSKLAGSKGTFSSWGYLGTECWSDPALELTVFVGTQVAPFWAHADLRQEIAAAVYGAFVSTPAAKFFSGGKGAADAGGMGGMMNMMMMMSMMGGMGGMGRM